MGSLSEFPERGPRPSYEDVLAAMIGHTGLSRAELEAQGELAAAEAKARIRQVAADLDTKRALAN